MYFMKLELEGFLTISAICPPNSIFLN
jgi:hypothetical protein